MSSDFKQVLSTGEDNILGELSTIFKIMSEKEHERGNDKFASGYETSAFMLKVHSAWLKVVGPMVAKHIQPLTVKGNCLILTADNPAYAQEFIYMKDLVLKKIKAEPELSMISVIKTRYQGEEKPSSKK